MRLRTQKELISEIRKLDPNTAFTPYALRRMVLSGKIPTVRSGRRYLIDADRLAEYLQSDSTPELVKPQIRTIK